MKLLLTTIPAGNLDNRMMLIFGLSMFVLGIIALLPVYSLRVFNALNKRERDKPWSTKSKIIFTLITYIGFAGIFYFFIQNGMFESKD